jgi:PKD repeat protein
MNIFHWTHKIGFALVFIGLLFACDSDNATDIKHLPPQNVDAELIIARDNSGDVTIKPSGTGVALFQIDFGDGSELSESIAPGESMTHTYEEGQYDVEIIAKNLVGEEERLVKDLQVTFDPPENLMVDISIASDNPLRVIVTPTAEKAVGFEIDFGEDPDAEPTSILLGENASYEYSDVGTYTISVTAFSGGEATLEYSEEVVITNPLILPIDFESATIDYQFNNFGGGEGMGVPIVDNPNPNDVNQSEKVGSYTKVAGSETWAGTSARLNESIDFSQTRAIAVDVYSPAVGTPVLFKVENGSNADIFAESLQNTSVANEWETLVFNLPDVDQAETYSIVALFFNFDESGQDETYLFDNIRLTDPVEIGLPLDFEAGISSYSFTEFDGAPTQVLLNPDPSGINTSAHVAEVFKVDGAGAFAGSFIDIDNPVDLAISDRLAVKVWSPVADVSMTIKLENPDTGGEVEASAMIPTANEWVEIEFDMSAGDPTESWTRIVYFFDIGNPGVGQRFYFDQLNYAGDTGPNELLLPLTFEGALDYTFTNFGGASTMVINNPDPSGLNNSNKVANQFKQELAETWGGSFLTLEEPIDFSQTTTMSMDVWSPKAGATVLLKLEDSNSLYEIEVPATVSEANTWEKLTFDFTDIDLSETVDIVVVFMDFGTVGMEEDFYFDNIQLEN